MHLVKTLTEEELFAILDEQHHQTVLKWLERGDGCAVYENSEIGHPNIGHKQFISYGSKTALIEGDDPPLRLPDIGNSINWRYMLRAICRRANV